MYSDNKARKNKHLSTKKQFQELLGFLTELADLNRQPIAPTSFHLRPDDLEDLPSELIDELSITSSDRAEFQIVQILEKAGGTLSLDQILVGYYRATNEIVKRPAMTNRMYRMVQKELAYSVPHRKGIYSLNQHSAEKDTLPAVRDELTDHYERIPIRNDLLESIGRQNWLAIRLHSSVRDRYCKITGKISDYLFEKLTLGLAIDELNELAKKRKINDLEEWCVKTAAPSAKGRNGLVHAIAITNKDGEQALLGTKKNGRTEYTLEKIDELSETMANTITSMPDHP